ncbi:MAG TPA: hypothetical protein VH591_14205 [Ktedonobacterales bacterium]|jgi:hypothetical protein
MERSTSRNLYLIGLVLEIVGIILFIVGTTAAIATSDANGVPSDAGATSFGILGLIAILVLAVGGVLALVAWIGALVKTAKLGQWLWFILLIVFSGITMLVYIFAGPTQPANSGQMA